MPFIINLINILFDLLFGESNTYTLTREYFPTHVYGTLIIGEQVFYTLELPWKDNKENISCIPEDTYLCKKIKSPAHGIVFQIMNVKDRTYIEVHVANFLTQIRGCVAIGMSKSDTSSPVVWESEKAFNKFMDIFKDKEEFTLHITS